MLDLPVNREAYEALSPEEKERVWNVLGQSTWNVRLNDENTAYVAEQTEAFLIGQYGFILDDFRDFSAPEVPEFDVSRWYDPNLRPLTRLEARLRLIQAGMWEAVENYYSQPERTPEEKAFFEDAQKWNPNDPFLLAGAADMGISPSQMRQLFTTDSPTPVPE